MASSTTSPTRPRATTRAPAVDPACAAVVELARAAAAEEAAAPEHVGEHLGVQPDADRVLTHFFACRSPAYRGWRWAVTVARAARARVVTVDEVVLLPGGDALLAPTWVPWSERLRPGDLRVGDLLPTSADDPRLVPGYADAGPDDEIDSALQWELGLGRARVLSRYGRDHAARRWYEGPAGPRAPIAEAAPAQCATCGFLLPLAGALRGLFGVCANGYAPDDGRVVSYDHGCGAHSEAAVVPSLLRAQPPLVDEVGFEVVPVTAATRPAGSVEDAAPSEELGHS